MHVRPAFRLVDFGDAARLERFGEMIVDRPHPSAFGARREPDAWAGADLRFDRERGWTGPAVEAGSWAIELDGLSLELRPTEAGQLGLFPEHLAMLPWLAAQVAQRVAASAAPDAPGGATPPPPAVLHLFGYTGLATLAMAAAGAAVAHVDSARPAVAWARRNADRSGLNDRPIRWIVDDALDFTMREVRRSRRYAGVVLDPPSYGHGPGGRPWRLEDHLGPLLDAAAQLLEPGGFVLLTAHTPGFDGNRLAAELGGAVPGSGAIERGGLGLDTDDGRRLELGAFARWPAGAS